MLENLFRLDGTPEILESGEMPPMSRGDDVRNIVFPRGDWSSEVRSIKDVTFKNVAFSGVRIAKVTFTDCHFEDCLFVGTVFEGVEFHGCKIVNCTTWKISMSETYLRPEQVSLSRRYRTEAANVGISVFQAMLANYDQERQDEFFREADIRFRRWVRYQIWHDLRRKKKSHLKAWTDWLRSVLHEVFTGFGYRPGRFFGWTLVVFCLVAAANHSIIGDQIAVVDQTGVNYAPATFFDTLFYTFSILTVLGFSTVTPLSNLAKMITVIEALAAIGWLGIFTAVLVKRFMR